MVVKKNVGIKTVVLLLFLLLSLFVFCTSSYASETLHSINEMTPEIANKIFDYFKENNSFSYTDPNSQTAYNNFYSQITDEKVQDFCDKWNEKNFTNQAEYIEQCLFTIYAYNSQIFFKIFFNNNTIGNNFNHLQMTIDIRNYTFFYRDDSDEIVTGFADHWVLNQSGTVDFSWRETVNTSGTGVTFNTTYNNITFFNSDNTYFSSKIICTFGVPQSIYLKKYNESSYNWTFLGDESLISPNPGGDTGGGDTGGGDTGGGDTGGGDTGGGTTSPNYKEDLNNINQGIGDINNNLNDIENKIPTSDDIQNSVTQGNKDFWGNTENMNGEDYESEINNGINDSIDEISGTLEENEIYSSIAIAEQKIIDLFLGTPEDFKIEWNDVIFMNTKLIPSGEVNFSQMCRENEALGRVKETLNIIVSAMISLSLFKYIFNLIMVTLGVDNPLVLEPQQDDITEVTTTRIGNKTYTSRKTYKSKKRGDR